MSKFPVRKVAICGQIRSGKDSMSNHLVERHAFQKFAFADGMKRLLHELFPEIPSSPKPRRAYQVFGEGMRSLDIPNAQHVWINSCMRKVDAHIWWHSEVDNRGANVVITDLRTPEEYEHLRADGYTIIRVTAPLEIRKARAIAAGDSFDEKDLDHETERHIEGFDVDYEIVNDGNIDELYAKVDAVMDEIAR
ncbi:hypothetical protein MKX29_24105 [Cytobacillus sp. FSL R7-0696]|uniref:hypothetical protein n=1 Tax=Cytobacillus sp. FSL R7-0696 TaxID=2921691 RepID=UPI0030F902E9